MEESKIKQLMEMGFSHEKAMEALRKANNDSSLAVAYLFDEPIEEPEPTALQSLAGNTDDVSSSDKQVVALQDTVEISNPQDIPQFYPQQNSRPPSEYNMPPDYDLPQDNKTQQSYDVPMYPRYNYQTTEYQKNYSSSESSIEYEQSVYNLKQVYKRIDTVPPIILPQRAYLVKNYITPLIVMYSQMNLFNKYVFETKVKFENDELPYNPSWFKNNIDIEVPEQETEFDDETYKFIIELQRSMGFLSNISKRSFISSNNLTQHFMNNVNLNIQTLTEQIEETIKQLYTTFSKINVNFDLLFQSIVESVSEEFQNDIYIFLIDSESRGRNIYESLNSLFWVDEDKLGNIRFANISPILTFQFTLDDESYQLKPFTLHEEFYPELYSSKYSQLIEDLYNQRLQIHQKRSSLSNEIMQLNTHDGKLIRTFLKNSINHLNQENELTAAQDLSNLQEKLIDLRNSKTEELSKLNNEYSSLNVYNYQNILDYISNSDLENPTKYLLVGVILSDCEFFYRSKKLVGMEMDESWYYIMAMAQPSAENPIVDYSVQTMTFEAVKIHVYDHSEGKQLILIYGKDGFDSNELDFEFPEPLRKFFDQDNQEIDQIQIELENDKENEIILDESEDDNETPEEGPNEEQEKKLLDI